MAEVPSIYQGPVRNTLDRLHAAAKRDVTQFFKLGPKLLAGFVRGKGLWEVMTPEAMKGAYLPVSPEQGQLLYLTARALDARTVVEYGTSFGISTIYLAAAVRDNGGGVVIGTEIEPGKHATALANLEEAGLAEIVDIRLGDAQETLQQTPEPIDLVLMDGWKELYLPLVKLLTPRLRPRAVVLGDNIFTFRKALRPYVEHMQDPQNGFASTTLKLSDGFEYSVYLGDR
ncbi:MAG: methyltransferase [bacterium]|nr:methyltransferase [bacterium]MCP5066517.1 methyltransferase [bacterium]